MHCLLIYLLLILVAAISHWAYLLIEDRKSRIVDVNYNNDEEGRSITDEQLQAVLSLLDPTTLVACRIVSKHWRYIATDPKIERDVMNRYNLNAKQLFASLLDLNVEDIPPLQKYASGILLANDAEPIREPKISSSLSDIIFAEKNGKVLIELTEEFIDSLIERLKYNKDELKILQQKFIFKTISENVTLRIAPKVKIINSDDQSVGSVNGLSEEKISVNVTWRDVSLSVDGPRLECIQKQRIWHKSVAPAELIFDIGELLEKEMFKKSKVLSYRPVHEPQFLCGIIPISNTLDIILLATLWHFPLLAMILLVDDNLTAPMYNFMIPALIMAVFVANFYFKEYKVMKKGGAFLLTLQVGFNLVKDPLERMYGKFLITLILYGGYYYAHYIIAKRYPLRHKRALINKITILLWIATKDWWSCFELIQNGLIYSRLFSLTLIYLVLCAQIVATYCISAKKIKRDVVFQICNKLKEMFIIVIYLL